MKYTEHKISAYELVKHGYYPSEPERNTSPLIDIQHFFKDGEAKGVKRIQREINQLIQRGNKYASNPWNSSHKNVIKELQRMIRLREKYGVGKNQA